MNRNITLLCLLAFLTVTQSVFAQGSLLNTNPLPSSRVLSRYGLQMGWWGQATIDGSRDKVAHVAIDERSVVVITTSGTITMFDAETGQKMWVSKVGRRDQANFKPVMNDRLVMVVAGLNVYAMDRHSGRLVWQLELPKMASAGPSADDLQLYVGSLDGSVYAFDLREILELYQERLLPAYTASTQAWRYQAGGKITSPPVTTGRSVLFASQDHSVYSVTALTRRLLFQFETDAPITAPLVKHDKNVYLASEDYNFYCLNAQNGQVHWSFLSGEAIRKSPHVIPGVVDGERQSIVYVLPELGGMSALSSVNGREIWSQAQHRAVDFLAATGTLIFSTDELGNVLILNRADGSVIGGLPTIPFKVRINNDRTDRLFLAREDGLMVMIREESAVFPVYHQFPDRRPILPELYDPAATPVEPASAPVPESIESNTAE